VRALVTNARTYPNQRHERTSTHVLHLLNGPPGSLHLPAGPPPSRMAVRTDRNSAIGNGFPEKDRLDRLSRSKRPVMFASALTQSPSATTLLTGFGRLAATSRTRVEAARYRVAAANREGAASGSTRGLLS
jgi:hypothetical protein